jgi:hypothetical protein
MFGTKPTRLTAIATILAAGASAAGLAIPGLYRDTPYWIEQARGTDLATLFVAVPVLGVALWASAHGSSAGRLAVVGGLLYLVYNYAIFAFSVVMNELTPMYLGIVGLALWSLVLGAQTADVAEAGAAVAERLARRTSAGLLIGVAALFGLLWLGQIATATASGLTPPDLARAGIPTNPVYALDLAFFLPLCALVGIGLLRQNRAGAYALAMLIWVPLMGAGVLGGFVFAAIAGEEVPAAVIAVVGGLSLVSAILAAVPLRRASGEVNLTQVSQADSAARFMPSASRFM